MDDKQSEEIIDESKSDEKTPDVIKELEDADGVVINEDDGKVVEDAKKTDVIEEDKKEDKKKEPDTESEVSKLKSELDQIRKDKSDLKKALHEARQEKKKPKEDDPVLTKAELAQIIKEHNDDPAVLMNAVKYMVTQQVKGAKKEVVNEVEVKEKQKQFDTILRERYKDFDDEDSPIRKSTEKAKDVMMIKDHPFADTLGTAVTVFANLPNISKYWFEEGKKAATDDKVNAARERQIKDGKVTPPGSKSTVAIDNKSSSLSETQMETAKRFGFDKDPKKMKIYMNQILGKK